MNLSIKCFETQTLCLPGKHIMCARKVLVKSIAKIDVLTYGIGVNSVSSVNTRLYSAYCIFILNYKKRTHGHCMEVYTYLMKRKIFDYL